MQVKAIFGPPGTGKTTELIRHAEGKRGLFLSYTRSAAQEAASRITNGLIMPSTLHSLVFRDLNLNRASVVDPLKMKEFSKATGIPFKGMEEGVTELQEGDEYQSVLQYARNRLMDAQMAYDHFGRPGTFDRFEMFTDTYAKWKTAYGYVDFDDMLELFIKNVRSSMKRDYLFLDEAQDCSILQWLAFEHLCRITKPENVVIAGDDDQAIYEWSGADPHGMIRFVGVHYGDHEVLDRSWRLTAPVYVKANEIISKIINRVSKTYWPTDRRGIIRRWGTSEQALDQLSTIAPNGALILTRDRFRLEEIKKMLNRELVPYDVYGGVSPWTGKYAKALRSGEMKLRDVPPVWQEFYEQADLEAEIKYHLSTIHSAKGREHDTVIVDLELPQRVLMGYDLDPDAETRVQYVGVTRAKETLVLCGGNPIV